MKLRSLLMMALFNAYTLCPVWAMVEDQQPSSSAPHVYSLKTLPDDILSHILPYISGPSLHQLWETGDKTLQTRLTQNVQAFDMSKMGRISLDKNLILIS